VQYSVAKNGDREIYLLNSIKGQLELDDDDNPVVAVETDENMS
jgi:hypothetical protein